MSSYIFLDDYRFPNNVRWVKLPECNNWITVRNYNQFCDHIRKTGIPKFVTYDHDLADDHYTQQESINYNDFKEKTGYDCAKFLVELCASKNIKHPDYAVHSLNPAGKANIISLIESYNKTFKFF